MSLLLTLDIGTTSVKTCIFNEQLKLLGRSSEEYGLILPQKDRVEVDPLTYWETAKSGIKKAIKTAKADPMEIEVITATTQGETIIPVDQNGNPLRNAIVWLDGRAAEEAEYINRHVSKCEIYATTGLPEIASACPIAKLIWLKNNEPEIYQNSYKFLLVEDFLIFKLTGKFITEKCIMSSTGYFNINTGTLWTKMLDIAGIPEDRFPAIMDCGVCIGTILSDAADELGINPGTIIATGAMDQAASAIGAGNITEGMVTETTGTALVVAASVKRPDYSNPARMYIMRHGIKDMFLIMPYNQTSGMVLKWFKDEFLKSEEELCEKNNQSIYQYLDNIAACVKPLSDGLLILPHFAGMLTPEINPSVKGVFFGVGLDTGKPHFVRAILEGVAYMLRQNMDLLETMGVQMQEIRSLGGGSRSDLWCKIKADVNNRTIHVMDQDESTSLGAAILGSMAKGIHTTIEDACKDIKIKKSYFPDPSTTVEYDYGYLKYKKLYTALKELF